MVLPQAQLEAVLEQRFLELGGELRRGWTVDDIQQDENTVTVHGPGTLTARYVAACDGGRSSIRKLLGVDFPGTAATEYFTMADVRLSPGTKELPQLTEEQRERRSMRRYGVPSLMDPPRTCSPMPNRGCTGSSTATTARPVTR